MAKRVKIKPSFFNKVYIPYLFKTKRWNVFIGGRASAKTDFICSKNLLYLAQNPGKRMLIIVEYGSSVETGIMNDLKKVAERFHIDLEVTVSPKRIIIKHENGKDSEIWFTGADSPRKAKGVSGYDILWFEEANHISLSFFLFALGSFRDGDRDGSIYISFNPESEEHWLKKFFFDKQPGSEFEKILEDSKGNVQRDKNGDPITIQTFKTMGGIDEDEIIRLKTTYRDNHFGHNPKAKRDFIKTLDMIKEKDPILWDVHANGNWGSVGDRVFRNWETFKFDPIQLLNSNPKLKKAYGMDKGYKKDLFTLVASIVDKENKILYIYDEMFWHKTLADEIVKDVKERGYGNEAIYIDSAEPMTNDIMRRYGLRRLEDAKKPPGSINAGVRYLKEYKIYIHPDCEGVLNEFKQYSHAIDRNTGEKIHDQYEDKNNHFIDALRYSMQEIENTNSVRVVKKASLGLRF